MCCLAYVGSNKVVGEQASGEFLAEDGFLRRLSVDVDSVAGLTNWLAERVSRAHTARIVTSLGTDISLVLGHPVLAIDGICERPGELDFFPPGMFLSTASSAARPCSSTTKRS